MSIATELTRLQTAKANIKTSIENKGVEVPSSALLDAYPALIDSITTEEKGYTEWPADAPTHEALSEAAAAWGTSIGWSSHIQYIIFKDDQIDDVYFNGSPESDFYVYFSDTETTESLSYTSSDGLVLSNHIWSSSTGYHWVFIAIGSNNINKFKYWNFFFSSRAGVTGTTNAISFFNADEDGNVYCPDGKGDLGRITAQLCVDSIQLAGGVWKAPIKLPLIYEGSGSNTSNYYCGTIKEIHGGSGVELGVSLYSGYGVTKIKGDVIKIGFKGLNNLRTLDGTLAISGNSLYQAFSGIRALDFSTITIPDTSSVTNMNDMFSGSNIINAPTLDMTSCTSASYMFSNCRWLKTIPSLTIPLVTDFTQFCNGTQITTFSITAPKAAYYYNMFNSCRKLQSIESLCTSNATSSSAYNYMFNQCLSLTTLGTEQVTDKDGNTVNPWIFNYSVDFGYCPLNLASIKHVMENLASGVSSQTFKLSKTSKTYLEAEPATDGTSANLYEQLAAEATTKGWTVSVNNSY